MTAALVDPGAREVRRDSRTVLHVAHDSPASLLTDGWARVALLACANEVGRVAGVGVAMPSPFEYARGVARHRHKFAALYGVNVRESLRDAWAGTPLADTSPVFGNDADLFALGEAWAGAARGRTRVLGVTLGTGLGSGFVVAGRVVTSGEGVPPEGELWNTPYAGALAEDSVSTRALVDAYTRSGGPQLNPADLAARARQGDVGARQVWQQFGEHLAAVLTPVVQDFKPDVVVVGGNLTQAWTLFSAPLKLLGVPCEASRLLDEAALLGAAALVLDQHG
ncbi:ROK family protein [Deinococcus peraridilitoris]|uniref:ROK family protein n=1 Tax=Deinococcus peraridilitoris TaxID=432329 RepID=UPI0002E3FD52|nr:ROK family protein [Deinococcus peraridilitoris]